MITAIVNFKLPAEIDAKKAAELFKGSAPKYRGMKGLVRKYYLFDEQSRIGGGVYLWKSRADAEALYTPEWKAWAADRYGAPPTRSSPTQPKSYSLTISTRRFLPRPASSSFDATGAMRPAPTGFSRVGAMPWVWTSRSTTDAARRCESPML
jgi:hypothetical protein